MTIRGSRMKVFLQKIQKERLSNRGFSIITEDSHRRSYNKRFKIKHFLTEDSDKKFSNREFRMKRFLTEDSDWHIF
jgi:hypothetical protein